MKKFLVLATVLGLGVVSQAMGQGGELVIEDGEVYTIGDAGVGPDETYDRFQVNLGGTLNIPAGTSLTSNGRSENDGGVINLDGGAFTINDRLDFGDDFGGFLNANSGTWDVLDVDNRGVPNDGWKLPDNSPNDESFHTGVTIGNADLYVMPGAQMIITRFPFVTFEAGGTGSMVLDEGGEGDAGFTGQWDPNTWLADGMLPEFEGFGLFAPEDEVIIISRIPALVPDGDPTGFDTRITSVLILQSTGEEFTWGDRVADGSWSDTTAWQKDGLDTSDIPVLDDVVTRTADPVTVNSGTLRVDTADQGAWSLGIDAGAATVVSGGNQLRIVEEVTIAGSGGAASGSGVGGGTLEVNSGGNVVIEGGTGEFGTGGGNLTVGAGGAVVLDGGTLRVLGATDVQGSLVFAGSGVVVGDMNGDTTVNFGDLTPFTLGLTDIPAYDAAFPGLASTRVQRGDVSADTFFNFGDLTPFVDLLTGGASGSGVDPISELALGAGTLANVEVLGEGKISNSGAVTIGQLTMGAGSILEKAGSGGLFLEQSGGANSLAAGSTLRVSSGSLVAPNGSTTNSLDNTTVDLAGGELVLSSTGSAVAFDSAITVSGTATLRAAQSGTGALENETVTQGSGSNGITSTGLLTLQTGNGYTLNLAGDVGGSGRVDFGEAAKVQVNGTVAPATVGFVGDTSNIDIQSGSILPTSAYAFNPSGATPVMSIAFDITGARDVLIGDLNNNDGAVGFTGALAHTGVTRIQRGALRIGGANNAPSASNIEFAPSSGGTTAVVESTEAAYAATIGTGAGQVTWVAPAMGTSGGGFSSAEDGSGTTVTLNGGADLDWDSSTAGFNGQVLQFGSSTANAKVTLSNNVNLGDAPEGMVDDGMGGMNVVPGQRIIRLTNNSGESGDIAEISGVVASTGTGDLLRLDGNGGGALILSGNNTFDSAVRLDEASLAADIGVGLPSDVNLQFSSGNPGRETVLLTSGTLAVNVGPAGGEVQWNTEDETMGDSDSEAGGFAARGGNLTVTLNGGSDIVWRNADGFNNTDALQLGSQHADGIVTLTNNIDASGLDDMDLPAQNESRDIYIFDNPASSTDGVVINGNVDQVKGLRFNGSGTVTVNGNVDNNDELRSLNGTVKVIFNGNQTAAPGGDLDIRGGTSFYVNGTVDVGGDTQFGDNDGGPTIGGSGQINMYDGPGGTVEIEDNATLNPGADENTVGTLSFNLGAFDPLAPDAPFSTSLFFMQGGSTFEVEFEDDGGNAVNDSVDLVSTASTDSLVFNGLLQLQPGWTIELEALESLTGVDASDEFDIFTFNEFVDLQDNTTDVNDPVITGNGTIVSATVASTSGDFDVTNAMVMFADAGGSNGRVFVTGVTYIGGGAGSAVVPEPASWLLASIGLMGFLARRRRRG